jgi:hypothetical protein
MKSGSRTVTGVILDRRTPKERGFFCEAGQELGSESDAEPRQFLNLNS